jgi:two-component system, sensor histidine kinase and response regulator
MDPSTGPSDKDAVRKPKRSAGRPLREIFETLSLTSRFRVTAIAAVTVTLLAVQLLSALWDTRLARSDAIEFAERTTESMARRLEATHGGALDDLDAHREFLAATLRLQSGEVLQRYVRDDVARAVRPPAALGWSSPPAGVGHAIMGFLAFEPLYVERPVQLSPGLEGSVSIVIDDDWIWRQAGRRLDQVPIALLLGCLIALLAANSLKRQVVEPLEQLAQSTRVSTWTEAAKPARGERPTNELTALATNFDVLADKLADYERDLRALRNSSAQQIIERTREMEMRLRKAESLTRSKDEFLANMSHEIRTPMNGVLGMAELLSGTDLDKRQRRYVDSMRQAAETMMQIINDILDDSKIEAGKMDLLREPFDVRELAESAGQLYAGRAESKKLEMICRVEPTVPSRVVGDVLRLRQVLGNLLSNAVKYTDKGEIEIRVGLDDSRDGQCRLHFSVADTGPGIAEGDQTGVFEAFTQLGNAARIGGTGLGLSIATRLVRLMGGEKIELSSQVGRGSTFSFVLPFEVKEEAGAESRASDEFADRRVLVIEDNDKSYMLLEETLANWSAQVTMLSQAKLASDKMHDAAKRGKPYNVVLLDHSLPDATPEELLRTIRLDPVIANTYVVLMTALDFNPTYEGTKAIAPDLCIAKPVRQQLLRSALEASKLPRTESALPAPSPAPEPAERKTAAERTGGVTLGLHVLVVDDNEINREVAVAMLEEFRCVVDTAEDGRDAVHKTAKHRYDVVLMDCQMPGMDGYAATEEIRREEARRGLVPTRIIALSANVLTRDRDRCITVGMNSFLAKPFKASELCEALEPVAQARGTLRIAPLQPEPTVPAAAPVAPPAVAPQPPPVTTAAPFVPKYTLAPSERKPALAAPEPEPEPDQLMSDTAVHRLLDAPAADASPTSSRLPVLDPEQVQAIRGLGKPLVFERLSEMLVASSKDLFARLDAALAAGDLQEIASAAHAIKSPVSNLGGRRLADLLERCETTALESGDLVAVRRTAVGLKAHYAALVAALESENRQGTGTRQGSTDR